MYGVLEGTGFEVIEPAFGDCLIGHARVERLWSGSRWAEGPAWFAAGRYLVWSDIPNNRMMRWDETCLLYTSPSPRDQRGSRMPSSA